MEDAGGLTLKRPDAPRELHVCQSAVRRADPVCDARAELDRLIFEAARQYITYSLDTAEDGVPLLRGELSILY